MTTPCWSTGAEVGTGVVVPSCCAAVEVGICAAVMGCGVAMPGSWAGAPVAPGVAVGVAVPGRLVLWAWSDAGIGVTAVVSCCSTAGAWADGVSTVPVVGRGTNVVARDADSACFCGSCTESGAGAVVLP